MKIAFFSDNFYPELSGISDSIVTLGRELGRRGHIIKFFAPYYSKKNYQKINKPKEEISLGPNVSIKRFFSLPYPNSPTGQARLVIPTLWRWRSVSAFKPDIIHTQLPFGVGLEALIAAKFTKTPLSGTSHTPIGEFLNYSPIKNKYLNKLGLGFVSWYYNKCDFVTAPSQSVFDEMKNYGFKKPHQVMSNPIDVANFQPVHDKSNLKKELNLKINVILYTGRLAPEKNIGTVIRALEIVKKKFPDTTLVITGKGSAENDLKKLSKNLKLNNNIKFVGMVSDSDLIKFHQAADVFTIMSTAETQSISLMKSFACGVPGLAARARAFLEYLPPERGFLMEPKDYKTLAEKIIYLFKNPAEREKLGKNGINFVKQISTPHIADEWEKIYSNIIKNYNKKI